MSGSKRYLDENGEFVERRARPESIDEDDEVISLVNYRKKRAQAQQAEKSDEHKEGRPPAKPKPADDPAALKAQQMIIARAEKVHRYSGRPAANRPSPYDEEQAPRTAPKQSSGSAGSSRGKSSGGSSASRGAKNTAPSRKNSVKKKRRRKLGIASLLLIIVLAIGCAAAIYYSLMGIILSGVNYVSIERSWEDTPVEELSSVALEHKPSVTNILLLGLDDKGGKGSRSDTMIIASIDSKSNVLRLCSIQRDNWVSIPGKGKNKINAAHAFGGAPLAMQTVESNFRVKLDGYVSINIESLIEVIDIIGGVDIAISAKEAAYLNKFSFSALMAYEGDQHMDGDMAVCYARMRKIDSDFGRTSRQRTLINAIIQKCRRDYSVPGLMRLAGTLAPYVTTSLTNGEISTLALKAAPALLNDMEQMALPAEGHYEYGYAGDMAVIYLKLEENVELLHEFLY